MFKIHELLEATQGRLISGLGRGTVKGISIDSRTIKQDQAFIAIKGNNFDGHDFVGEAIKKGASCIIAQKRQQSYPCGVHRKAVKDRIAFIEVGNSQEALGAIARFHRLRFDIPVIAVTGSNGKTTTKEMAAWILSQRFRVLKNEGTKNNQVGVPLTLLNLRHSHDLAVLEIGTSHFGEIGALAGICQPNIGIITNIGPAHLKYLDSTEGVLKEKYTLIENLNPPRIAILNTDDALLIKKISQQEGRGFILGFGLKKRSDFSASGIRQSYGGLQFLVNRKYKFTLDTLGYYNIYNALAAGAVARLFGMGYRDIASRLAAFKFPPSRLKVIELNHIKFIDDTYNSNPVSLGQALEALKNFRTGGRRIFVMGDMLELGKGEKAFHYQAGRDAAGACDVFITVGKRSRISARAARENGMGAPYVFSCGSSVCARKILFEKISPTRDDVVLIKGSRLMQMENILKNAL